MSTERVTKRIVAAAIAVAALIGLVAAPQPAAAADDDWYFPIIPIYPVFDSEAPQFVEARCISGGFFDGMIAVRLTDNVSDASTLDVQIGAGYPTWQTDAYHGGGGWFYAVVPDHIGGGFASVVATDAAGNRTVKLAYRTASNTCAHWR
jgi:hypothetical protein